MAVAATEPRPSNAPESPRKLDLTKRLSGPSMLKRLDTAFRSFRVLRDLTPQQVDSFMQSYVIYSLDWADEQKMIETLGPDYPKKVGECLANYYRVLNHLCAMGELEKMYVPPIMDPELGILENQLRYEGQVLREYTFMLSAFANHAIVSCCPCPLAEDIAFHPLPDLRANRAAVLVPIFLSNADVFFLTFARAHCRGTESPG
jgi:hypothetical protein